MRYTERNAQGNWLSIPSDGHWPSDPPSTRETGNKTKLKFIGAQRRGSADVSGRECVCGKSRATGWERSCANHIYGYPIAWRSRRWILLHDQIPHQGHVGKCWYSSKHSKSRYWVTGCGWMSVSRSHYQTPLPLPPGKRVRYTSQEHTVGLDALGMRNSPAGNPIHFLRHSVGNLVATLALS